jgi:hypothetical protein
VTLNAAGDVDRVVIAVQHAVDVDGATDPREIQRRIKSTLIEHAIRPLFGALSPERLSVNGTGSFLIGGPIGDAGVVGRKIVVDAYGPNVPVGGGAYSGSRPILRQCETMRRCRRHGALWLMTYERQGRGSGMKAIVPVPVAAIYKAVAELEAAYPGRQFTPDGHLVGSIGEVVAAEALGLKLYPGSHPGHDAFDGAGDVRIKMTAGRTVAIYATCERLVVLQVVSPDEAEIVYDGPASRHGRRWASQQRTCSPSSASPSSARWKRRGERLCDRERCFQS